MLVLLQQSTCQTAKLPNWKVLAILNNRNHEFVMLDKLKLAPSSLSIFRRCGWANYNLMRTFNSQDRSHILPFSQQHFWGRAESIFWNLNSVFTVCSLYPIPALNLSSPLQKSKQKPLLVIHNSLFPREHFEAFILLHVESYPKLRNEKILSWVIKRLQLGPF